jgi:hypothetical protein
MLFAGVMMSLSVFGVAYADQGEGVVPNTRFTELPGVVGEAPAVDPSAAMMGNTPSTGSYVTRSHPGTWVFPPNETGGGPNS